jgi:hypothetical protein
MFGFMSCNGMLHCALCGVAHMDQCFNSNLNVYSGKKSENRPFLPPGKSRVHSIGRSSW